MQHTDFKWRLIVLRLKTIKYVFLFIFRLLRTVNQCRNMELDTNHQYTISFSYQNIWTSPDKINIQLIPFKEYIKMIEHSFSFLNW